MNGAVEYAVRFTSPDLKVVLSLVVEPFHLSSDEPRFIPVDVLNSCFRLSLRVIVQASPDELEEARGSVLLCGRQVLISTMILSSDIRHCVLDYRAARINASLRFDE